MKLQKFKERNNRQKYIIIFTIACVLLITGVFLYKSFASFQVIKSQDYINGSIEDPGDIYFAFYKNGKLTKEIPIEEEENFFLDENESYCGVLGIKDENIKLSFNPETRDITITGAHATHTKCYLYFRDQYHITVGETTYNANVNDGSLTLTKQQDGKIFMCNNGVNIKEENNQIKIDNITKDTKCNYYDTSSEALQAVDSTPNYMFFLVDETINSVLTINKTQEVTIDLNGHKITKTETDNLMTNNGSLTISSSNSQQGILSGARITLWCNQQSHTNIVNANLVSTNTNDSSTIGLNGNLFLNILNSKIEGPYAIGYYGGNMIIDNSELKGICYDAIRSNGNSNFSNVIIKNKSKITGQRTGIFLSSGGNVILDGDEENYPTITSITGKAINLGLESSNLYFKYGETYGIEENVNEGTTYIRNGSILKTETKDGKVHTYLE